MTKRARAFAVALLVGCGLLTAPAAAATGPAENDPATEAAQRPSPAPEASPPAKPGLATQTVPATEKGTADTSPEAGDPATSAGSPTTAAGPATPASAGPTPHPRPADELAPTSSAGESRTRRARSPRSA
ncbi:hypothetical protein ACFSVJ_09500 [Prauserella oleivorans]